MRKFALSGNLGYFQFELTYERKVSRVGQRKAEMSSTS